MLKQLRRIIKTAAPQAKESISYRMPYYSYHGRLAYFAAAKHHVGYYVMPGKAATRFAKQIKPYRTGRATMQFPYGTKIPLGLISKLVKARAQENEHRKSGTRY